MNKQTNQVQTAVKPRCNEVEGGRHNYFAISITSLYPLLHVLLYKSL